MYYFLSINYVTSSRNWYDDRSLDIQVLSSVSMTYWTINGRRMDRQVQAESERERERGRGERMKVTHDWYCTVRVLFICNRLLPTWYSARRRNSDQGHGDASGGSPDTFRHPGGRAVSQDIICEILFHCYIWSFKYFAILLDVIIINRTVAPCE